MKNLFIVVNCIRDYVAAALSAYRAQAWAVAVLEVWLDAGKRKE